MCGVEYQGHRAHVYTLSTVEYSVNSVMLRYSLPKAICTFNVADPSHYRELGMLISL